MISRDVLRELDGIAPGRHAMLVYDTKERKEDVLFSHLQLAGRYDGAVYVCSEETTAEAESAMRSFGIDVDERKKEGTLLVKNYDQVYIVDDKVDSPGIIKGFSDLAYDYSSRGYGMRAAAEMSCFFRERKVDELVSYENDLHRKFSFPAFGICGFSLMEMYRSNSLDSLWPIIKAHGTVIMTGPGGSFVLPPDEVKPKHVEKAMAVPKGSIREN
jgi:hypothetical protein